MAQRCSATKRLSSQAAGTATHCLTVLSLALATVSFRSEAPCCEHDDLGDDHDGNHDADHNGSAPQLSLNRSCDIKDKAQVLNQECDPDSKTMEPVITRPSVAE